VPATSANLGPGFDALGLSLRLFNSVKIEPAKFSSVSINGEGSGSVNLKRNNIFLSIFNEIFFELTGKNENFRVVFENNIPFSRGLGSSSAVIVGAIASAYEMAGFKASKETVLNKAIIYETHPDNISPAVHGGFVSAIVKNTKPRLMGLASMHDLRAARAELIRLFCVKFPASRAFVLR